MIERRILNSEFDLYLRNMDRAIELVKYFEGDLVYFKDSFAIATKLVKTFKYMMLQKEVLKIGVEECDRYLETNIKKLDAVLESKKHLKRFRELLRTLENATT